MLITLRMGAFDCTSIQRQCNDKMGSKCNSNSIIVVNYNINNKNNDNNTNKVIIIMKVKQQL